ncbi:MAG TPA: 5-formyltetrahydrofolate cyclo-ligase [Geminicoccaceae bacterium]
MTADAGTASKPTLRSLMVARRAALDEAGRARAAATVADVLARTVELPPGATVAGFWPLAGEIDPRPALDRFAGLGFTLALPRMQGKARPLAFHRYAPGDRLVEGPFEVMQPTPDSPLVAPDLVLVPLLAFDRRGHRVGFGAGFYDRTLAALRRERPRGLRAIGIAFACQEVERVPEAPYDEPLDGVVTEEGPVPLVRPAP